MNTSIQKIRKDEKGFTLVELAVVMIIIGLLIGGILKGQELITNARVTSTIGEMEGISAAYNDFRNQFNAIPGDMNTAAGAAGRVQGCNAVAACANGDGDGLVDVNIGAAGAGNNEGVFFFGQMLAAGYITGMDGTANNGGFGISNPGSSLEGGFLVGDTRNGFTGFTAAEFRPGVYLVHSGIIGGGANSGSITGQQAASIDRRLDDGTPNTGAIIAETAVGANGCRQAAGNYNQAAQQAACMISYRM